MYTIRASHAVGGEASSGVPQVRRWLKLTPLIGFRPRACLSCPRSQSSSVGVWLQNPCVPFTHQLPRLPGQNCQNQKRQRGVRRASSQHEGTRGWHVRGTEGRGRGRGGCAKTRRCFRLQGLSRLPMSWPREFDMKCVVVLQQSCVGGLAQRNTNRQAKGRDPHSNFGRQFLNLQRSGSDQAHGHDKAGSVQRSR